jgi:hypothetical protein
MATENGGQTWNRSRGVGLEADVKAKGAFAASNSSLLAGVQQPILFGTGGAFLYAQSYVGDLNFSAASGKPFKMTEQWKRTPIPLANESESAGVFSVGYHTGEVAGYGYMVAVGGDYMKPNESARTAAWTNFDSKTWTAATKPPHGYRSAVAWDADAKAWIAAGTNGSDVSYDDGKTWQPLDNGNWNALSLPWVVGPNGRIAKLSALPKTAKTP